jgi:hypothetical protein
MAGTQTPMNATKPVVGALLVFAAARAYFRELSKVCANADEPARPELEDARRALAKQE